MPSQRIIAHPPVPIAMGDGDTTTEEGRAFYKGPAHAARPVDLPGVGILPRLLRRSAHRTGRRAELRRHLPCHRDDARRPDVGDRRSRAPVDNGNAVGRLGRHVAGLRELCHDDDRLRARDDDVGDDATQAIFVGLLATTYTLLARAIAIPSTTTRTLTIGVASMVPLLPDLAPHSQGRRGAGVAAGHDRRRRRHLAARRRRDVGRRLAGDLRAARRSRGVREGLDSTRSARRSAKAAWAWCIARIMRCCDGRPRSSCSRRRRAGAENIERFEREVQLTASSATRIRSPSSTTGARSRACSTTRWSISTASISISS